MFKKIPILKYESSLIQYKNSIVSAKTHIPDWYKKIQPFKDNVIYSSENGINRTIKLCVPFMDSLTTGYMINLPYDIYIKHEEDKIIMTCPNAIKEGPRMRGEQVNKELVPTGHFPMEFSWNCHVAFTFPKDYSILLTHPLNRHDLPFTTLSGIIDGGVILESHGNYPFYLKEDFEGIIKQGTPVAQIIPFRQENWKSTETEGLAKLGDQHSLASTSVFRGWYKNTFWKNKKYE
jgi:hypothetical protein